VAKLSLSRAWDETRGVLSRDGKLIGTVALALVFLPGVIAGVYNPNSEGVPKTGGDLLLLSVVAVVGIVGQLATIRLALGTRSSVGEAIGHGLRRAPAYIAASMIWLLPFLILAYFLAGPAFRNPAAAPPSSVLAATFILIALIIVSVRMLMTSPVASSEHVGPIDIIRRSWNLTSGNWWRLFAFLLVFLIVAMVSLGAAGAISGILTGILFGAVEPMSVAALFVAFFVELVTTIVTVGFLVMVARIYAQLSGPDHADVSVPSSGT
jgi:hypothetical protein